MLINDLCLSQIAVKFVTGLLIKNKNFILQELFERVEIDLNFF